MLRYHNVNAKLKNTHKKEQMEILVLVIIAAIASTVAYFFHGAKNRHGERLYGRKHLERAVNATARALWPQDYESEQEVIERKERSRKFADHIIGVDLLSEEEAWGLFKVLFRGLAEIDLGDITLDLVGKDTVMSCKNQREPEFEDACSPTERLRFFFSWLSIPEFGPASSSIISALTGNLSIFGWYDSGEFQIIPGEPTSEDLERIEKLENVQDKFERENEETLIAIRRECDDIVNGKVICGKEKINTVITWLENYDEQQATLRFSKDKEVRKRFLNNADQNRKRLIGLRKKLKTMMH